MKHVENLVSIILKISTLMGLQLDIRYEIDACQMNSEAFIKLKFVVLICGHYFVF